MAEGSRTRWRKLPEPEGSGGSPEAAYRVRKRSLPQHRGVLEPSNRHLHDSGQRLYPPVRVLQRPERGAAGSGFRRAQSRRRGCRSPATALRRHHQREPGRPQGRWCSAVCPHHPCHPRARAHLQSGGARAGFSGSQGVHGYRAGRPSGCPESQYGDRAQAVSERASGCKL